MVTLPILRKCAAGPAMEMEDLCAAVIMILNISTVVIMAAHYFLDSPMMVVRPRNKRMLVSITKIYYGRSNNQRNEVGCHANCHWCEIGVKLVGDRTSELNLLSFI
jgi:hypothetical protein